MSIEDSPVKTHTNRLAGENSPYLLSHANNPVDWFPWGDEALEKAKREDKPIFLSIGYAACHWCHVMERESFENEDIAAMLNEHFVSIKVDREQRPDLDQIYMTFTTALAGQGGWPMSVFLTPDLKPFFAGTYFPPDDRFGRPGFKRVISEIARAYREEKDAIAASSKDIFEKISEHFTGSAAQRLITNGTVARAADILFRTFDEANGGFGNAPKFPHSLELSFFLRYYRISGDLTYLNAAEKSLKAMADGGIYDHLAGGFARYSTDPEWLVPHFEKMLYDNALLVPAYAEACQVTGDEFYRDVVINTLDFILNEMTDSSGGFYSTIDADSEGEEGKFYVWKKEEIDNVLGADAEIFNRYYGVTSSGNFEGRNILHVVDDADRVKAASNIDDFDNLLDRSRRLLLSARNKRSRPATDDKILTSWNGLALSAFCKGYQITGDARYLNAAIANAAFVRDTLYQDGHLTHAYRQGKHSAGQFLEDYAYYVRGLIDLYQTDHTGKNLEWLTMAAGLASSAIDMFMDNTGRFFLRPDNQSDLIMRPVEETDGATPAPGSIMIGNLLKLNRITDNKTFLDAAEKGLKTISGLIDTYATGMTSALLAADYYLNDKVEIVIVGQDQTRDKMLSLLNARYLPNAVVAFNGNGDNHPPLFDGRLDNTHLTKAYVCRNSVCELPVSTVEDLQRQLGKI